MKVGVVLLQRVVPCGRKPTPASPTAACPRLGSVGLAVLLLLLLVVVLVVVVIPCGACTL